MRRAILLVLITFMMLTGTTTAADVGLSVHVKRNSPGIPGERPAELVLDIINSDIMHYMEAFLFCQAEDATWDQYGYNPYGGAQYTPSPLFRMDRAPSMKAATLYFDADTEGDKEVTCTLKYMPYKEEDDVKLYLKKNGEYTDMLTKDDSLTEYRELTFEATVPFVTGIENPVCPEDVPLCTAEDIYGAQPSNTVYAVIPVFIAILVAAVVAIRRKKR